MLVVTNGQSGVEAIRRAGISAELLSWDDVLHEGPVPGGLSDDALARVRAEFLSQGEDPAGALEKLRSRDRKLRSWTGPIVLWFEHDLYDQLQLIQVMSRLDGRGRVFVVPETTYIAMQEPGQLRTTFDRTAAVTEEQSALARDAWRAFTSERPETVQALLDRPDIGGLPNLAGALQRWLESFPDGRGLSRTEGQVLDILSGGPSSGVELFRSTQAAEEAVFRGDWSFWLLLEGLSPDVIRSTDGPLGTWELTETGQAVVAGSMDRVGATGIDSWRGGTHLTAANDWRWTGGRLVRRA